MRNYISILMISVLMLLVSCNHTENVLKMKTGKFKELEYKRFGNKYIIRIDPGGEVISLIEDFCTKENIKLGTLHGLGAANRIKVGLFDVAEKKYYSNVLKGDFEICPLYGNISQKDGETYIHCHINVANIENQSFGGHCNECHISATFEGVLEVIDGEVGRRFSEKIGLNLYDFE